MEYLIKKNKLINIDTDLLILRFFEGEKNLEPKTKELDKFLNGQISKLFSSGDFKAKTGESLLVYPAKQIKLKRMLFLGLGKKSEYDLETLRTAIPKIVPVLKNFQVKKISFALIVKDNIQALTESLLLSSYTFAEYKKQDDQKSKVEQIEFILDNPKYRNDVQKAIKQAKTLVQAVFLARDLGNHPSNVATPSHLAEHALALAKKNKQIKVKVLDKQGIQKEKMGALLAVSQGSYEEPKFIIMQYRPRKTAPVIALVGKGITFDSGGLSLKPWDAMAEMKFDMAGAATVMATIKAAADLKLPVNLVGLIPATENLPSGTAVKPGDIVRSRSGKTIEVINTDAEGRMVLSDALDYAKKFKPSLVIDFATLTGAILVALGDDLIGAFSNKAKLLDKLAEAGGLTGEKIWPMPLYKDYEEFIKSDIADLRNLGTTKYGDSINAANFLKHFVDYPWVHLDIAGVAWATRQKPYRPKGATGTGVRLAIEFLKKFRK